MLGKPYTKRLLLTFGQHCDSFCWRCSSCPRTRLVASVATAQLKLPHSGSAYMRPTLSQQAETMSLALASSTIDPERFGSAWMRYGREWRSLPLSIVCSDCTLGDVECVPKRGGKKLRRLKRERRTSRRPKQISAAWPELKAAGCQEEGERKRCEGSLLLKLVM